MRHAAFLSPHAILTCVFASEISAKDCVSLPVLDQEGEPIDTRALLPAALPTGGIEQP